MKEIKLKVRLNVFAHKIGDSRQMGSIANNSVRLQIVWLVNLIFPNVLNVLRT